MVALALYSFHYLQQVQVDWEDLRLDIFASVEARRPLLSIAFNS